MVKFTKLGIKKQFLIILTQKALYREQLPQNSLHQTMVVSFVATLKLPSANSTVAMARIAGNSRIPNGVYISESSMTYITINL